MIFFFSFYFSRSCPASLEASLTRAVLDEAKSTYLSGKENSFFISRIEQKFRENESKFNNLLFYIGSSFAISMPNETTDELDADANEVPMRRNPRSSNCKYF